MPTSSSAKKNGPVSRKRVDADPSSMKRSTGGSAFTRCESCQKDIPVATADMHDCQDSLLIKASLDKMGKDAAEKTKAVEKSKTAAKTDAAKGDTEKGRRKRKESGKVKEKKVKRSKPEKDPNKPKRPNTAYFLFLGDFRVEWRKEHPTDKMIIGDLAKAASAKWKTLSEEEKKPYIEGAAEKKADYDKAVKSYKEGEKEDKSQEADESPADEHEEANEEEAVEEGGDESLVED